MKIAEDKLCCVRKNYYSRIYIIKDDPSRIVKEHFFINRIINEYKTLSILKEKKFYYIPKFELTTIGKRNFLVLENLGNNPISPNTVTPHQEMIIAKAIKKLHTIKANNTLYGFVQKNIFKIKNIFSRFKFINRYHKNKIAIIFQKETLKHIKFITSISKNIPDLGQKSALINCELSFDHFFINNDKIKIIDWENSCFGDPAYDLATFFNNGLSKNTFFNYYSKFGKHLKSRINYYQYLISIDEILHQIDDYMSLDCNLRFINNLKNEMYIKLINSKIENLEKMKNALQNKFE